MVVEAYSNPVASVGFASTESGKGEQLKNEDFRKLLQTPRVGGVQAGLSLGGGSRGAQHMAAREPITENRHAHNANSIYYKEKAKEMAEFQSKYKDRARERRLKEEDDEDDALPLPVFAPTADIVDSQAAYLARIEQTKYLGGDVEHTHLVKGLDYALLQKVKADLTVADNDEETGDQAKAKPPEKVFRTAQGQRIFEAIFENNPPIRNELFLPGRMAYSFIVGESLEEPTDVPITLLRSKAEVAGLKHELAQAVTNDLVLAKLSQIFSAIRRGVREKKERKKKDREMKRLGLRPANGKEESKTTYEDENIYGDVGDYVPPTGQKGGPTRQAQTEMIRPSSYFNHTAGESGEMAMEIDEEVGPMPAADQPNAPDSDVIGPYPGVSFPASGPAFGDTAVPAAAATAAPEAKSQSTLARLQRLAGEGYEDTFDNAYDYGDVALDDDSDVEPDYSKMDQGKKAGPSRFDYDDEEDWARDKERQEAMPKAAFQYGVKMGAGRTTRRNKSGGRELNKQTREKRKIDQQLNKMQQIWKRKGDDSQSNRSKRNRDD